MTKSLLSFLLLFSFLLSSGAFAEPTHLAIHGSTVFIAAALAPNKATLETETGLTLDITGNSAGEGVEALAKGETTLAMITGSLEDVAAKVNAKKPGLVDPASLKAHEIGTTRVAFAIHPSNPVTALDKTQLVRILKGETTNWKEVGGEDKPIILVTGIASTGLRTAVEKEYLGGASVTSNAKTLMNSALIGTLVEKAPNALGILVVDMLRPSMKEITIENPEPIKLAYVTKGEPSAAASKLISATTKLMKK
ncbi:MAG: substrate-binding domain-containing protein [Alphaproteobacteria bacterium]|nr:substrate-binding domain-containing protein [Alphaproteobacteria bacterium]